MINIKNHSLIIYQYFYSIIIIGLHRVQVFLSNTTDF